MGVTPSPPHTHHHHTPIFSVACRLLGLCPARVHHGTIRPAIAVRTLATSSIGGAQFTIMR